MNQKKTKTKHILFLLALYSHTALTKIDSFSLLCLTSNNSKIRLKKKINKTYISSTNFKYYIQDQNFSKTKNYD